MKFISSLVGSFSAIVSKIFNIFPTGSDSFFFFFFLMGTNIFDMTSSSALSSPSSKSSTELAPVLEDLERELGGLVDVLVEGSIACSG